jgi:uncharacterized membrane protein
MFENHIHKKLLSKSKNIYKILKNYDVVVTPRNIKKALPLEKTEEYKKHQLKCHELIKDMENQKRGNFYSLTFLNISFIKELIFFYDKFNKFLFLKIL